MFDPYVLQYRALEGIDRQQLLRSGELRHVESDARLKVATMMSGVQRRLIMSLVLKGS